MWRRLARYKTPAYAAYAPHATFRSHASSGKGTIGSRERLVAASRGDFGAGKLNEKYSLNRPSVPASKRVAGTHRSRSPLLSARNCSLLSWPGRTARAAGAVQRGGAPTKPTFVDQTARVRAAWAHRGSVAALATKRPWRCCLPSRKLRSVPRLFRLLLHGQALPQQTSRQFSV
jgi:hypothetical protein